MKIAEFLVIRERNRGFHFEVDQSLLQALVFRGEIENLRGEW